MSEPRSQATIEPRPPATAEPPHETAAPPHRERDQAPEVLVEEELLVEDVSIDGMCGVY
jgi:mycofactocin precursor